MTVYPNPTSAGIWVGNPGGAPLTAVLYDATGRVVQRVSAVVQPRFDLAGLPMGSYFVHVYDPLTSRTGTFTVVRQ